MFTAVFRLSLIAILTLSMLALQSLAPSSREARAAAAQDMPVTGPPSQEQDAVTSQLLQSDASVTALFELTNESVAAHTLAQNPSAGLGLRAQMASVGRDQDSLISSEQRDFEGAAAGVSPTLRVNSEMHNLINAVSVTAPGTDVARIAKLPGIRRFQISRQYHALLSSSVPLINAPTVWNQLGGATVAGRGIKIAILDTGIDITNSFFSGSGFVAPPGFPRGNPVFTNGKVIVAKTFLSDPTANPADQNGHGTHLAGIAAGVANTSTPLGPVSGVAPGAFLGNYRVLDASGNGDEGLIVNGLEAAFTDGFDIALVSFGGAASVNPGMLDGAVEVAAAGGMTVVAAAGNGGTKGAMTITSPGTALNAITVAASSNAHIVGSSVDINGPGQVPSSLRGISAMAGVSCGTGHQTFPLGPLTLFDESLLDGKKRGCNVKKLPAGSLAGRVSLIQRGNCDLVTKINNAAAAGASAVIIYNQDLSEASDGGENLIDPDTTGANIPSVFIRQSSGQAIKAWVDANPGATVSISGPRQFAQTSDILAPFSSIGPTAQSLLKPDITAPGENIYSAAITTCNSQGVSDPNGFLSVSGTSQAAAHVAGGAALIKELHPTWTVSQIKSALVNGTTANVTAASGSGIADVLASGAGRVDLAQAASVGATLAPSNLSFGFSKLKTLRKGGTLALTLNITAVNPGVTTFNFAASQSPINGVFITPSVPSMTLSQGQTGQVLVTLSAKQSADTASVTGFIIITYSGTRQLRVPFWAGF